MEPATQALRPKQPWWRSVMRFVRRKPLGAAGAFVLIVMVLAAVFADHIAPYDPLSLDLVTQFARPGLEHPFGSDYLGRDVLSRVIHGARVSLFVGTLTAVISVGAGAILGILSGYLGGWTDLILQRFVDGLQAFPVVILVLVIVTTLGPSLTNAIIAISAILMTYTVRVARGHTLSIKENMYVEAAHSIGASELRIMVRHILPNIAAPLVILGSIWFANAVIIEASLSFLGLGAQPPTPSWGRMLSVEGRVYMERAPWLALFPGIAISLVVLATNFLGDALRDVWDPRLRGAY